MKKSFISILIAIIAAAAPASLSAQFNLGKLAKAGAKAAKAATISDADMAAYVKEYITWMDEHNQVTPPESPYTQRLDSLTRDLKDADGIPLNFKVYYVIDVNAFACPDGSVRVFSSLMDIVSDEELLGIIGHEIGHVAHRDSKKAFRTALLTSALRDAAGSTGKTAAALTSSQLGDLGESLANSRYSREQERNADDFGYDFLKSHDINPRAMAKSFERLKQLEAETGVGKTSKMNQLFSSHPDLDERIKRMTKRADEDGFPQ
ncbi:MAG: M48 family metallopeptidase [Muribaculaceae bacterium]|nr:M48 family metallopeptidase [Muribaculaceae bacterium]